MNGGRLRLLDDARHGRAELAEDAERGGGEGQALASGQHGEDRDAAGRLRRGQRMSTQEWLTDSGFHNYAGFQSVAHEWLASTLYSRLRLKLPHQAAALRGGRGAVDADEAHASLGHHRLHGVQHGAVVREEQELLLAAVQEVLHVLLRRDLLQLREALEVPLVAGGAAVGHLRGRPRDTRLPAGRSDAPPEDGLDGKRIRASGSPSTNHMVKQMLPYEVVVDSSKVGTNKKQTTITFS